MKIVRKRVLMVRDIGPQERAELERDLVAIFLRSFEFHDTKMFAERVIFRDPQGKLTLFYDANDEVVGFFSLNLERFDVAGHSHVVVHASAYSHPGVRGSGGFAFWRVLEEVLRFKLRNPRMPICLIGEASTPSGYARVTRHFARVHPRPGPEPPPQITALVTEVMRARGFAALEGDPWRVCLGLPLLLRDPERMLRYVERGDDPNVAYYVERNPGYLTDNHWLVVYVPFDLAQLYASIGKAIGERLGRLLDGRWATPRRSAG